MYSRRSFIAAGAAASFVPVASPLEAQDACAVFDAKRQKSVAPDAAIGLLKEGNQRFVSGKTINCDLIAQVKASSKGQAPFAAVIGCIDSRVPPELIFDQRIGAIFVARVAGNFVNTDVLGSVEYACKVAGAKAIVVLGHSQCGAIKGAIDKVKLGNLTAILKSFEPALKATKVSGEQSSHNHLLVQAVAVNNARLTAKAIAARSAVLAEMGARREIVIASAMHDIETGKVTFLN